MLGILIGSIFPLVHSVVPWRVFNCHLCRTLLVIISTKCFLAKFNSQEKLYLNEMVSVTIGNSISFDHTFKVAANIGYHREDNVWVSQYESFLSDEWQWTSSYLAVDKGDFIGSSSNCT